MVREIAIDPEPSGERRLRAARLEPTTLNWGAAHLARVRAERNALGEDSARQETAMQIAAWEIVQRYSHFVQRWVLGRRA